MMDFTSTEFRSQLKPLWEAFLDQLEPLRPELFRFGLHLTRNPFDAEDLVADALLKAFSNCAMNDNQIGNPRAYIARVMVNAWIDQKRREAPHASTPPETRADEAIFDTAAATDNLSDTEDAATQLYTLGPRARAALVLKEVLGYTHEEIAEALSITAGNAKVILHRAKSSLADSYLADSYLAEIAPRAPRASRACVQRFVETFLTYDVDAICKLLIDDVVADNFPVGFGAGIEHQVKNGWLRGSFYHHDAAHDASQTPYPLHLEVHEVCDEPVVLVFRDQHNERALEEVWRLEEVDGHVAKIVDYCFRLDLVQWVAEHLELPYRRLAYRHRGWCHESNT